MAQENMYESAMTALNKGKKIDKTALWGYFKQKGSEKMSVAGRQSLIRVFSTRQSPTIGE